MTGPLVFVFDAISGNFVKKKYKKRTVIHFKFALRALGKGWVGQKNEGRSELLHYRPLPSSKNPDFQNEAKCTTFLVKMSFICMRSISKAEHLTSF